MSTRRIRITGALVFTLGLLNVTAFAALIPPHSYREINQERMASLLQDRKVNEAGRFAVLMQNPKGTEKELLAQYYLLSCQPRAAAKVISQIEAPNRKQLFQAVLLALTSVQRPKSELAPAGKSSSNQSSVKYPVKGGEIWRDEWKDLKTSTCKEMPTVSDAKIRNESQRQARQLFESLSPQEFLIDFHVVALAMDVGVEIPDARAVLKEFVDYGDDPYYKRLVEMTRNRIEGTPRVEAKKSEETSAHELSLSGLHLKSIDYQPHPIEIPILLRGQGT